MLAMHTIAMLTTALLPKFYHRPPTLQVQRRPKNTFPIRAALNTAGSSAASSSAAALVSPNGPAAPAAMQDARPYGGRRPAWLPQRLPTVQAARPPPLPQRLSTDVSTFSRLPANGNFTTPTAKLSGAGHAVYAGHVVLSFSAAHDCAVRPLTLGIRAGSSSNISSSRLSALIGVISSGACFCEEWEDLELREPSYSRPSPSPSPSLSPALPPTPTPTPTLATTLTTSLTTSLTPTLTPTPTSFWHPSPIEVRAWQRSPALPAGAYPVAARDALAD